MVERTPLLNVVTHIVLLAGLIVTGLPIVIIIWVATLSADQSVFPMTFIPGKELLVNLSAAWSRPGFATQFLNSFIVAIIIMVGKIGIASITAFALTYFRFRFRAFAFTMIFLTLMLPLEVRIVPTYAVATNALMPLQEIFNVLGITGLMQALSGIQLNLQWSMLDNYLGLTLPLIATATGTFLFRQFFLTVPDELVEAARIDGAGPMRFFIDILMPLSRTNIAALAVIMFVFGWNQYLWPLMVTTRPQFQTVILGLSQLMPSKDSSSEWNLAMAATLVTMLPPVLLVVFAQRWFVRGLISSDK